MDKDALLAKLENRQDAAARFLRLRLSLHLSPQEFELLRDEIEALPAVADVSQTWFSRLRDLLGEQLKQAVTFHEFELLQQADGHDAEAWRILLRQLQPPALAALEVAKQPGMPAKDRERGELLLGILTNLNELKQRGRPADDPRELLTALQRKTNEPLKRLLAKLENDARP